MNVLVAISKGIDAFTEWVGFIAYWLMPIMVMVGVWNVFGRFFGQAVGQNLTSNLFIELQWYLFSLTFLLGGGYVLKHNEHVRVDVIYTRYTGRVRAWVNLLGAVLFLIPFASLIIYFSWGWLSASWSILEQSPDPSGLPRYPIKSMIVIGMGLLIIQGIAEVCRNIARLGGAWPLELEEEQKV